MTTTRTTTRGSIYARISKDRDGNTLGVERQQEDCQAIAARRGIDIVNVHVDNDLSAYKGQRRPAFEAMLAEIKSGAIDVVIVYHTDRLYRNRKDTYRFLESAIAANVSVYADKSPDLDLSTASGRMVADILASVSRQESERESERVIRSNVQRAEAGRYLSTHRTFGFDRDGTPLEPEASAIRTAVVDVLGGVSLQAIAKRWNDAGLLTTLAGHEQVNPVTKKTITVTGQWNGRRVRRILMNPKMAGRKLHRGKEYDGTWTALVDRDTHEGLVRFLSDPTRVCGTSFERKYLGSSLYRCAVCDGTTKIITKGAGKPHSYTCRQAGHVSRVATPLDDYVTATILERVTQPDAADLLAGQGVDIGALSVKREGLQRKLDGLTELFNTDAIDTEQFGKSSRDTRGKLADIDRELADATRTSPAAALIAAGVDGAWELWSSMSPTQRAQAVDELVTVTVRPCPRGLRAFDSDYVDVQWRRAVA